MKAVGFRLTLIMVERDMRLCVHDNCSILSGITLDLGNYLRRNQILFPPPLSVSLNLLCPLPQPHTKI